MRRKTREKVKKGLIIAGIVLGIILIIVGIILVIKLNQKPEISYDDGLVCKNYFIEMTIDLNTKTVKRDDIETSLTEEFAISEDQQNLAFTSAEEMRNLLSNSVFDISEENNIFTIKNNYQTKKIIVEADDVKEKVEGEEIVKVADNLYVLEFYSEKLTKAMYNYYKEQDYIQNIFLDDVFIDEPINDISQTMYGEAQVGLNNYHSLGVTTMGLDNYQKIINDNGNPSEIVVATIGYGVNYQNEIFNNRVLTSCYNFILDNNDISETIAQGSRIAEVIVDSTTENVKLMPLVVVTDEGYTTLSSIIMAINYAIQNSDVVCYELINSQSEPIDIMLQQAFKENIPVCCSSTNDRENYPANHGMTIAISSLNRNSEPAEYSSRGEYIDFTAPSTDVEEIFDTDSTVSRWSGAGYSNAHIAAAIALIKSYNETATILDVYNFLRNYCEDLGDEGKDELYGYGCPKFQNLTIADIDKDSPTILEINYENENWEVLKQVKILASDNIRISSWAIIKNEGEPKEEEWQTLESVTPNLDVTTEVTENGTYYIWVRDSAGNTTTQSIQVDKVDNTPPEIAYTINEDTLSQGYVTITVTAQDSQSGLYESPFSWDKTTWSQENSTRTVKENGRYTVYAEDNLGNIGEKEIVIDCFPQEGTYNLGPGNIITSMEVSSNWTDNTNNNVKIELNKDLDITGWQIMTTTDAPTNFVEVNTGQDQNNNNQNDETVDLPNNISILNGLNIANTTTSETQENNEPIVINTALTADVTYYLWVRDSNGSLSYQTFTISKAII